MGEVLDAGETLDCGGIGGVLDTSGRVDDLGSNESVEM